MKGIILAGGTGSRLFPVTLGVSKQLLPIYDKPMIYYPLSVLMLAKIKDILLITNTQDIPLFRNLFGDGSHLGLNISYAEQKKANGIAEALIIGESFIQGSRFALILGDNLFYGQGLSSVLSEAKKKSQGATIFGYRVKNAKRYGVVTLNSQGKPIELIEKPENPLSNIAVTGLYFYDDQAVNFAKTLHPSSRGELEISDINCKYLEKNLLDVHLLGRGTAWLDAGTHDSLLQASQFIQTIEERQGFKIACIEELSYLNGWISKSDLLKQAKIHQNSYGKYLESIS